MRAFAPLTDACRLILTALLCRQTATPGRRPDGALASSARATWPNSGCSPS